MFGKKKRKEKKEEPTDFFDTFRDEQPAHQWPSPDTVYVQPKEFEGSQWGLMTPETKQRIQREAGLSLPSGQYWDDLTTHPLNLQTGTVPWGMEVRGGIHTDRLQVDDLDVDALWKKMYERMRKVIVVCKYCNRPQTIDNEVCSGCGAPLPVEFL